MEPRPEDRRKYHRFKAPKESVVTWKSTGQNFVSRVEAIGLGGLFLYTANPLALNSVINLIFHLAVGKVHARAAVRRLIPGKGMGVQFVQMLPEDRARLNQFLLQLEAESGSPTKARTPEQGKGQHFRRMTRATLRGQLQNQPTPLPTLEGPSVN